MPKPREKTHDELTAEIEQLPLLVSSDKLMASNAIINQVNTLSGLLGPVIGGIMFGLWGIYPILILNYEIHTGCSWPALLL